MSGCTTFDVLRKGVENRETMETSKKTYKRMKIFDFEQFLYIQSNGKSIHIDYSGVSSRNFDLHAFLSFVLVLIETFNMDCSYQY